MWQTRSQLELAIVEYVAWSAKPSLAQRIDSVVAVQTSGSGALVVGLEVLLDRGDQVGDAVEDAAADRLVGQLAEPALDEVQP